MSTHIFIRDSFANEGYAAVFGNIRKMSPLIYPIYAYCLAKDDPQFYLKVFELAFLPIETDDWLMDCYLWEIDSAEFNAIHQALKRGHQSWKRNWPRLATTKADIQTQEQSWSELFELLEEDERLSGEVKGETVPLCAKFEEFNDYLARDWSVDYWEDVGISDAADMLEKFEQSDWDELEYSVGCRFGVWLERAANALGDLDTRVAYKLLRRIAARKDVDLKMAALGSIYNMLGSDLVDADERDALREAIKPLMHDAGSVDEVFLAAMDKALSQ